MLSELAAAIDQIETIVSGLEPDCLEARFAVRLVELLARGERLCAAGKTLAVDKVDSSGAWGAAGDRTCADWLARTTGTSLSEAIGVVETARRLPNLPATDKAFRTGTLSAAQAKTVTDAATTAPASEARLLESAARNGLAGLQRDAVKAKAAAENGQARAERHRQQRSVRTWTDDDGMGCGMWRLPAEAQAQLLTRLKAETDRVFNHNRKLDVRESPENYTADALINLLCHNNADDSETEGETPVQVPKVEFCINIDYEPLLRGDTNDGETCEIPGIGPISVATARQYLLGDSFLKIIIRHGIDIRTVAHLGRHIPAALLTAIKARDQECVVAGCHRTQRLEIHHDMRVDQGGPTALWNLRRPCDHHHDQISYRNYTLGPPDHHGKCELIPPSGTPPDTD